MTKNGIVYLFSPTVVCGSSRFYWYDFNWKEQYDLQYT